MKDYVLLPSCYLFFLFFKIKYPYTNTLSITAFHIMIATLDAEYRCKGTKNPV